MADPVFSQQFLTGGLVEQPDESDWQLVIDTDGCVGVAQVVNPGNMLVADALDAVVTKTILQNGRALKCFGHTNFRASKVVAQVRARSHSAS